MGETKRRTRPEHRWPVVLAVLLSLSLYTFVPSPLNPALRFTFVGISLLLLISLVVLNPHRLNRETRWSRIGGITLAVGLVVVNFIEVILVIGLLVTGTEDGVGVLLTVLQFWISNVVAYALLYWELDRGGPVARRIKPRAEIRDADFRFPQDEDHDAIVEVAAGSSAKSDWAPGYVDYLYFSSSNMMAFSPTDAMPLTQRVKLLMGLQSFTGFVVLALVISRAVSILA
jgi:uncharacterized membrane protein